MSNKRTIAILLAFITGCSDPPPPKPTISAEKHGENVGGAVAGFGKGVVKGAKERLGTGR